MTWQRTMPIATLEPVDLEMANRCLCAWGHKMGPLRRPNGWYRGHALVAEDEPVAVVTASTLIRERVGGGLGHLTRDTAVELSRLCACRPHLCRVILRMWREFVFPGLKFDVAISYQDADLHTGHTYRFDGWFRAGYSTSGTDQRSGRRGRRRWIWVWPPTAAEGPS